MKKTSLFIWIVFLLELGVFAQHFDPPLRLELNINANTRPYNTQLVGKRGVVLSSLTESNDKQIVILQHYDTNFKEILNKSIPIPKGFRHVVQRADSVRFYAVYQLRSEVKAGEVNMYVILYNLTKPKIDVFSLAIANHEVVRDVYCYGDCFVYNTVNDKEQEFIYTFTTKDLQPKKLYQDKTTPPAFACFYQDNLRNCLWIVSKFRKSKKEGSISLLRLDKTGEIFAAGEFEFSEKELITCNLMGLGDELIFFGNYTSGDQQPLIKNDQNGVYAMAFDGQNFGMCNYFPFSDLSPDISIPKRSSNTYAHTYFLANNDSILLFAADFYTPEYIYRTQSDYGLGFHGMPSYSTQAQFIGYRYSVGCIFTCGKTGKIIRNNYLNYNGLILKSVRNFLQTYMDGDQNLVYFASDGKLYSLIFNENLVLQPVRSTSIEASSQFQIVSSNDFSTSLHWYDNYFAYYGYQTLSNRMKASRKTNRWVFYINKLVFD